jgi:hypothetical protein
MALDGFTERDPAERSAFSRLFYRNRGPTWFGHWVSQFFRWWGAYSRSTAIWLSIRVPMEMPLPHYALSGCRPNQG